MFSKAELEAMASLFEIAAKHFGNHGCNDFELPATEENLVLARQARSEDDEEEPHVVDGKIITADFVLMYFLRKRCQKEIEKLGTIA